jgi:phage terminase small subunit
MTPKQRRFADEYLIDFNATQAAIRTGYAAGSAEVTGSRLLRNAKVQAAISAAQQQQTEKLGITVEGVLSGIAQLARADIRKLFDGARQSSLDP